MGNVVHLPVHLSGVACKELGDSSDSDTANGQGWRYGGGGVGGGGSGTPTFAIQIHIIVQEGASTGR